MNHSEIEERAFYRRQAARLLQLAESCKDRATAEQLLMAAEYYIDKLEEPLGPAVAATRSETPFFAALVAKFASSSHLPVTNQARCSRRFDLHACPSLRQRDHFCLAMILSLILS